MSDQTHDTAAQTPDGYLRFLQQRRAEILGRVREAAARAGRSADEVGAIAVSKTVDVPAVRLAWQAGWHSFGENRPQELKRKVTGCAAYPEMADVRFHMIGNLQTNKINQVLESEPVLVHSVSSLHLAAAISKRADARGITVPALLEVNVSGEESKSGFSPDEARESVEDVLSLPGLDLRGLMTMAPAGDPDMARRTFSGLRELAEDLRMRTGLALDVLSCGMSDDFPIAVEEGSTLLRLGRVVFDPGHRLV